MSILVSSVSGVAESLFATLFPSDCRLCGSPLINISRLPVCRPCLADMARIAGDVCSVCGERVVAPSALNASEIRCALCRRLQPPFVKAVAYGSYDGGLRELIHLRNTNRSDLPRSCWDACWRKRSAGWSPVRLPTFLWLCPCRCMPAELRQRGFNQSELIAQHAVRLGVGSGRIALNSRVCSGDGETQSQIGSTRISAAKIFAGAFAVSRGGRDSRTAKSCWSTMCSRLALRCPSVRDIAPGGRIKIFVATVARTLKDEVKSIDLAQTLERRSEVWRRQDKSGSSR